MLPCIKSMFQTIGLVQEETITSIYIIASFKLKTYEGSQ